MFNNETTETCHRKFNRTENIYNFLDCDFGNQNHNRKK